jgi:hypothetical protein
MALRAIPMGKVGWTSRIPSWSWLWVTGRLLLLGLVGFLPSRLGTLRPAPEEAPRPGARAPHFLYEVSAVPTAFFIGPEGVIRSVVVGGAMSKRESEGRLAAILPKGGPDGP